MPGIGELNRPPVNPCDTPAAQPTALAIGTLRMPADAPRRAFIPRLCVLPGVELVRGNDVPNPIILLGRILLAPQRVQGMEFDI